MARRYRRMRRRRNYSRRKARVPFGVKRYVKRALSRNVEMKLRQYTYSAVGLNTAGGAAVNFGAFQYGSGSSVAGLCAGVANGTGEGQRIGNSIILKGAYVNFALQPGDNTNYMRILLVTPKKAADLSSTSAFVQQLLSNTASSGTQWLAPVDTDVFKVYFDKRFWAKFSPVDGSTATSVPQARFIRKFVKFNKKIRWQLSAPVLPTNDVFLVAISDSAIGADPGAVAGSVKIWYQDA